MRVNYVRTNLNRSNVREILVTIVARDIDNDIFTLRSRRNIPLNLSVDEDTFAERTGEDRVAPTAKSSIRVTRTTDRFISASGVKM